MSRLVVDASVIVKWALPDRDGEGEVEAATSLLDQVCDDRVTVLQPPHWLAEVAAVLVRLAPERASQAVGLLYALELPATDDPEVHALACDLSRRLGHHLFDTLYHSVALHAGDARLVTADQHYLRKARALGSIVSLAELR